MKHSTIAIFQHLVNVVDAIAKASALEKRKVTRYLWHNTHSIGMLSHSERTCNS